MKKIISIILAISIAICSVSFSFAEPVDSAFNSSLARVQAAINYMNAEYFTTELGNEFEYGTQKDKEELQALANLITINCKTDTEKANAIYDWMVANVDYSLTAYTAIDTFRNLSGICSGHAQLFTTLCRLSGIECAVIRGYKADTTYVNMDYLYKNGYNKSHEWSMAFCDGQWLLYDDLWGYKGISDTEIMAHWYFLLHVDGIVPSISIIDANIDLSTPQTYYDNGTFICYAKGAPATNYSNATLQVGGCLRYTKYYYTKSFNSYYKSFGENKNSVLGQAIAGGCYTYNKASVVKFKDNGIVYNYTVFENNDTLYLANKSSSVIINDTIDNNGLSDGYLNMYIGESIDLSELYPTATISSSNNNITIENGVIKATGKGNATVKIKTSLEVLLQINVYGDIIGSNDTFKALCDHEECHEVDGKDYCDYCGAEVKEEVVATPVVEPVVEEPIVNEPEVQVVSEPAIENPEAIQEPVVNEPVVETPVVNEPVVKESKPEEPIVEAPTVNEEVKQVIEAPVEQEQIATEPAIEAPIIDTPVATPTELVEEPKTIATNEVVEQVNETIKEEETALVDETKEEVTPTVITINITLPEKVNNNQTLKDKVITLISSIITLILQFANEIA